MTIGAWALFLASLAGMWAINKSNKMSGMLIATIARAVLAFSAGVAMARIALGDWLASAMLTGSEWIAGMFDGLAAPVALSIATLVAIAIAVFGLLDKRADKPELAMLIILPTMFLVTSAGIADPGAELSDAWFETATSSLSNLLS